MNLVKTYWYRFLAIAVLLMISALYGPVFLNTAGINPPRLMGDGSIILSSAFILYLLTLVSVVWLVIPSLRNYFIPRDNRLSEFLFPLFILIGYIVWGSFALYSLSQATDL
jgi:hypothetical protein